jgi:hypothetical protein
LGSWCSTPKTRGRSFPGLPGLLCRVGSPADSFDGEWRSLGAG